MHHIIGIFVVVVFVVVGAILVLLLLLLVVVCVCVLLLCLVRKDLLQKMMALDPNEPTEEEKELGITKLRYMTYREIQSSSRTLGFRVEGIRVTGQKPQNNFRKVRTLEDVEVVINSFLPPKGHNKRKEIMAGFIGIQCADVHLKPNKKTTKSLLSSCD